MNTPVAADGLAYEDVLPLSWVPLPEGAASVSLDRLSDNNVAILARLASLEERPGRKSEEDELEQEISRLSNKIDLLIELVASLARERQPLPPAVAVALSARSLRWASVQPAPPVGARLLVSLYLNPGLAQPLQLPVEVEQVEGERIFVRINHPTEASLSALEQHVFLHHRRAIAESRKQNLPLRG